MAASLSFSVDSTKNLDYAPDYLVEPRWYVAYTCANREKRVRDQFEQRCFESLLPLYETVRRWKDRRVRLQRPLFPGYVFVRIALMDRLKVLQVPSVVRLVGFNGVPCPLSDCEIESMQRCFSPKTCFEPYPYVRVGRRVRVKAGPFKGLEGIVVRKANTLRFVISLDLIHSSASAELGAEDLEQLCANRASDLGK